ncbi:MAG: hypothetical protein HKN13_13200, partial [Rhodothermales bacterium]|nr:hypothetical protein [Rhodothermales bacterium]
MNLGYSPFFLLAILAVLLAFTVWTYRRTVPDVGQTKVVLGALRFAALGIVAFLLFRPAIRTAEEVSLPPLLAVLVDGSESLSITGGSQTDSLETIRQMLDALPLEDIPGEVRLYNFGSIASPVPLQEFPDSVAFDQQRTNFSSALEFVRDDLQDENLGAVLLISDGRHNTGRNPLFVAERYPAPVYTVVLGDTTIRRDLLIESVVSNDIGYVNTAIPIRVTIRTDGYETAAVSVAVSVDGVVTDSKTVTVTEARNEASVDLSFVPVSPGFKRVRVSTTRLDGESTYRNNTDVLSVRVLDRRKRILHLASGPGPDVAAMSQILASNTDFEVRTVVQKSSQEYYGSLAIDSLSTYDLIVLSGYPGQNADQRVVDGVVRAATEGTPLLFLVRRNTNLGLLASKMSSVMAVRPDMIRADYFDVTFTPTPIGTQHTIMEGIELGQQEWLQLSPLSQNNSRWRLAPDARALATSTVRGIDIESPLLVSLQRSGYRSVGVLASGFWRWRNVPENVEDLASTYQRLIENVVQ